MAQKSERPRNAILITQKLSPIFCVLCFLCFLWRWSGTYFIIFSAFSYTPVYVRLTQKKKLCNLNFAAQIIGSKFIIDQKLRHFKVLLAVS